MPSIESRSTKRTEGPTEKATRSGSLTRLSDRVRFGFPRASWQWAVRQLTGLTRTQLPPRPGVLTLTAVLLLGLCALLACCTAHSRIDSAHFDLPADDSSPKLESAGVETVESVPASPEQLVQAPPQIPAAEAPQVPLPTPPAPDPVPPEPVAPVTSSSGPPLPLPPPVESVPMPVPPRPLPSVEVVPVAAPAAELPGVHPDPHRGDTAMMNSMRILSLQALLAATLAAQSSFAGQIDGPAAGEPDRMTAVLNQLQDLTKSLNSLVTELKSLPANLSETNKSLYAVKAQEEINQLKQQVGQLQREVSELRNRAPATSQSLYPPAGTATGRLRLINSYVVPVSMIINDVSYPLAPGEVRLVEGLRAGPFTYEVLGAGYGIIQPRVSRALVANDTFTIRVEPIR